MRSLPRGRRRVAIIDPPSEVNLNLPNLAVAFAASHLDADVVDLHALPFPASRVHDLRADEVALSVRPHTLAAAERIRAALVQREPSRPVRALSSVVDVQCCYPFVQPWETFAVDLAFDDSLPLPEYERFDSFNYLSTNWRTGFWAYPIMTSLGCPFGCTFCAARRRPWRPRSAAHAARELARARERYGIRRFEIVDDVFNLDEKRVLDFCARVGPLGLRWACVNGIRADRLSERQARAMAAAGCEQVGFGVESTDPRVLRTIEKGESIEQIERAVGAATKHIPTVTAFFIIGLPGSTQASDRASLRWARERGVQAYCSFHVGGQAESGSVFYGTEANPTAAAYDPGLQRQVYLESRRHNRKAYARRGLPLRVALSTLRAARHYDLRSWLNHSRHLARRGISLLRTGDIQ